MASRDLHQIPTQMVEARVPLKAAQQRLGHSRPEILLNVYAHVLDASADLAAATLSGSSGADFQLPWWPTRLIDLGLSLIGCQAKSCFD